MKQLFFLLLLTSFSYGQKASVFSVDMIYTSKVLANSHLSADLNTGPNYKFGQPLNYVGISTTGMLSTEYGNYRNFGFSSYEQLIPQTIQINDSVSSKINGFNTSFTTGFNLFNSKPYFDVLICAGFNTGRVRLTGDDLRQKNPYFAPMISIVPRLTKGKLSMQLRFSYAHDISKGTWLKMRSKTDVIDFGKFSSSGFNLSLGIGYYIN